MEATTAEVMLTELERCNCWTLAHVLGHDGPYRRQRVHSAQARWRRAPPDATAPPAHGW
ncbi:hypothetical protein [Streptomyces sp. MMG1121]|uniref:hypothetical protein n=1 Tax=Streptomyces sp. MMG1121 TaxID=1415544 RepID=UPI00131E61E0|nr:hypothetical protein [Streptomyces sp. MMG1121]